MTNHVRDIHDRFMSSSNRPFIAPKLNNSTVPNSNSVKDENVAVVKHTSVSSAMVKFEKGQKVSIDGFGICTFEGLWEGKYAFYPYDKRYLPDSEYLINRTGPDPYLLIPKSELHKFIN